MNNQFDLKNEDGSTLVETLVAMAILVSVLLPTSLFLGYMSANSINADKITALGLAQNEMEKVLANEKYADKEIVKERWIVKSATSKKENRVFIEVLVYRKNKSEPVITLNTERLLYEDNTPPK